MTQNRTKTLARSRSKDSHGRYTIAGIYELAKEGIDSDIAKSKYAECNTITFYDFRRIIILYFYFGFQDMLNGLAFKMYKFFGEMRVVKTKVKLYKPKSNIVRTVNGKKVCIKRDFEEVIKRNKGFWYFFNWDAPKAWRTHEFDPTPRWKAQMMKKVEYGFDYLDYTFIGINDGYVRKIR